VLTKYIGKVDNEQLCGTWIYCGESDGTSEDPIELPYVNFKHFVDSFIREFYEFSDNHPEYQLSDYGSILNNNDIKWNRKSMKNAAIESLDEQCILSLIMGAIRAEKICEGALLNFFADGRILKWLKRLKNIDDSNTKAPITEIYLSIGGYFGGYDTYYICIANNKATLTTIEGYGSAAIEKQYSEKETKLLLDGFEAIHTGYWNCDYVDPCICDGTQWQLAIKYEGNRAIVWNGSNDYPENWDELLDFFGIEDDNDD